MSILRDGKRGRQRKHFDVLSDARAWKATHQDAYSVVAGLVRETTEQLAGDVFDVGSHARYMAQLGGRAPLGTTVEERAEWFIDGIRSGAIRERSGLAYSKSTCDDYERRLRNYFIYRLGPVPLIAVTQATMQAFVDWVACRPIAWKGKNRTVERPSRKSIENILAPIRVIFRQAIHAGEIRMDPTSGLWMPDWTPASRATMRT